jgi:pimeloyl-ACP methyl ester carboxylesterase
MPRSSVIAVVAALLLLGEAATADAVEHRLMVAQNGTQQATEPALREIIGQLQAGTPDFSNLEPELSQAIRQQMAGVRSLLARLGSLQRVEFIGNQNGLDLYRGIFANGATIWAIAMSPTRKIAALSFRPDAAASNAPDPNGLDVTTGGLSGTLRKPANVDRPPVVLLIAGSGPTDRDGNQSGHGPGELRQIAEALAEHGIASLRYDKRAVGRSAVPANFREDDLVIGSFVDDAAAWLAWLEQRADLGPRIVAGHSEGGLIAILLAKRAPVSALVLLATPGRRFGDVLREQLSAASTPKPILDEALAALAALERGESVANVSSPLLALLRPSVQPFIRSLMAIDPPTELAQARIPVLVAQGGHDLQVSEADAAALLRARPDAVVFRSAEMNHVLKLAPAERAAQDKAYSDPSVPLAPVLVDAIAAFVRDRPPGSAEGAPPGQRPK